MLNRGQAVDLGVPQASGPAPQEFFQAITGLEEFPQPGRTAIRAVQAGPLVQFACTVALQTGEGPGECFPRPGRVLAARCGRAGGGLTLAQPRSGRLAGCRNCLRI